MTPRLSQEQARALAALRGSHLWPPIEAWLQDWLTSEHEVLRCAPEEHLLRQAQGTARTIHEILRAVAKAGA